MKDTLPAMNVFPYGAAETRYLSWRDPRLGRVIEAIGPVVRPVWPDLFGALCRSIIGQQISNRAAATVVGRFDALLGEPMPQRGQLISCAAPAACRCARSGISGRPPLPCWTARSMSPRSGSCLTRRSCS
ncbi:MAG: hypothetical protein ACLT1W_15465 [Alistipes onderdonkii]